MEFNLGYWPLITGGIVLIAIILCAVFKPYVMDLTDDEIDNKIEEYWSDCGKVIGTNLEEEYSSKPSKIPNAIYMKLEPNPKPPIVLTGVKLFLVDTKGGVTDKLRKGNWYV